MNPAAEKTARSQKALVRNAWLTVKFVSVISSGAGTSPTGSLLLLSVVSSGNGSGSNPISSGRLEMNRNGGITPSANVKRPRTSQVVRQSHPVIMNWAARGMIVSPAPLAKLSAASPKGRRRINQLLIVVGTPSSRGPEKIIRPGTYREKNAAGLPTNDKPTAKIPVSNEEIDSRSPEPCWSIHFPTKGEMNTAHNPPRLTALENSPRDHPSSCVIGTTNTDKVATAMIVREDRLTATVLATMTHP